LSRSDSAAAGEPAAAGDTQKLLRDLARETLERYREINVLYRASETIGASLDADEVPRLLIDEARRVIPFDAAVVLVGEERPAAEWAPQQALISSVRSSGRPDYTDTALCVPLRAGEQVLGMMVVRRADAAKSFTAGDEKLLFGLASQAGVALERARMHLQETRRLQLEEELAVARRIQLTLLPAAPPTVPGWSFAATYEAAREVGGDFYDFLDHALTERRRLVIVIADVTGKGVPAALMMAYSRAVLRAESMAGSSPVEVLENANRLMIAERQSRLFLSALYAELDLDACRLTYASAGHDAPILVRAGGAEVRELEAPGVILGAFADTGMESRSVELGSGDTVVFYTDGVTEARDPERRLFGDERLRSAVAEAVAAGGSAESVLESVGAAVAEFTAGAEQSDDLTIVVLQRE